MGLCHSDLEWPRMPHLLQELQRLERLPVNLLAQVETSIRVTVPTYGNAGISAVIVLRLLLGGQGSLVRCRSNGVVCCSWLLGSRSSGGDAACLLLLNNFVWDGRGTKISRSSSRSQARAAWLCGGCGGSSRECAALLRLRCAARTVVCCNASDGSTCGQACCCSCAGCRVVPGTSRRTC